MTKWWCCVVISCEITKCCRVVFLCTTFLLTWPSCGFITRIGNKGYINQLNSPDCLPWDYLIHANTMESTPKVCIIKKPNTRIPNTSIMDVTWQRNLNQILSTSLLWCSVNINNRSTKDVLETGRSKAGRYFTHTKSTTGELLSTFLCVL